MARLEVRRVTLSCRAKAFFPIAADHACLNDAWVTLPHSRDAKRSSSANGW
jgi:hypothetical protein